MLWPVHWKSEHLARNVNINYKIIKPKMIWIRHQHDADCVIPILRQLVSNSKVQVFGEVEKSNKENKHDDALHFQRH